MVVDVPDDMQYTAFTGYQPNIEPDCYLMLCQGFVILPAAGNYLWPAERWNALPLTKESLKADGIVIGQLGEEVVGIVELNEIPKACEAVTTRQFLSTTGSETFKLLSHGLQILSSRKEHRFCGCCGHVTQGEVGEWVMACPNCGHRTYPTISPCIIVLVHRGDDILLVRHLRHGKSSPMHTVVAGFVEPGETAEAAVQREVFEETGLKVTNIEYRFSQSWPFPHSLMLGFHAAYESGELVIDEIELCEGGWYHKDQLPELPPEFTISRQLINLFE